MWTALQDRLRRQWYTGTGLLEWGHVERELPRSPRAAIARSNRSGRAAPPDLACLAARRAGVMAGGATWAPVWS